MPLQADPTVVFALKEQNKNTDGQKITRVYYKDLKIESLYNTYKNKGLPPGLIAMPDVSSIDAVLNAPDHKYLYMCVDTEHVGQHVFAERFGQHKRNARKYRKWLKKNMKK